ncbi:hypothetical protein MSAN_02292700 [Mycena sanguinolenta]|uniref:F-box domain-containing protein n=1 Tax=Mycena sanguinolenta TaxID=230812 RepID=A0A8H6X9T0_9AGAR|nr:hypothetical protein MSAN_02292700 [Mycena sanguinolenta]
MSSLDSIPNELLERVFLPLNKATLLALCTTNHPIGAVATRLLYQKVTLSDAEQAAAFVNAVKPRPDLQAFVQELEMGEMGDLSPWMVQQLTAAVWTLVRLQVLEPRSCRFWVEPGDRLSGATFPSLRKLSCVETAGTSTRVAPFLERHPGITHLSVFAYDAGPTGVRAIRLPRLREYTGTSSFLLRCDRAALGSVESLEVRSDDGADLAEALGRLGRLRALRRLTFEQSSSDLVRALEQVAEHVPWVRELSLSVRVVARDAPSPPPAAGAWRSQIAATLCRLPCLRLLAFDGHTYGGAHDRDNVAGWLGACSGLEEIWLGTSVRGPTHDPALTSPG